MRLKDAPIQRKLMVIILQTTMSALLLLLGSLMVCEFLQFQRATDRQLATVGKIIAANSTAALAFANHDDAAEILSALKAEPHITAAALYDANGKLFSKYPPSLPAAALPATPRQDGIQLENSSLAGFLPVVQDNRRLGTLYLRFDLALIEHEWLRLAIGNTLAVIGVAILGAWLISQRLQRQISRPILALAETAKAVSERRDYSVRVEKFGKDELGQLTDAFNQMLADIGERESALREENAERRRAEEQLRASFKEIDDLKSALDEHAIVAITDSQGKITFVNDKFCAISKYSREELLGHDHRIINSGFHPKEFIRDLWMTIARGTVWHGEIKNRAKDGSLYWVDTTIVPFLNNDGKPRQYVAIRADITERKRVEAEIHQLNAELEERVAKRTTELEAANQELEAFSYSISHDLRAPLRAVNGFAGIVLEDFGRLLPEEGRHYLERICNGGKRMGELIDDLLAFSRLSRQSVNREPVDSAQIVQEVLDDLKPQREGRLVEILTKELPSCNGDPALLKQVWVNLISNAIKYTRGREPAIVEIGCVRENGEAVYFVRDNGAGFDMQYAHKLFGVFRRLHRADQFEGTGVGLAIVQRIVHRHGGRVWAEAQVDQGATFFFTIGGTNKTYEI